MQTIIQEVRQALQQGRFETCQTVIDEALCAADDQTDRLVLLEMLAEAQSGLDDPAAAAHTWEQAYHQSPSATDRARLFEQACQSYEQAQNLSALERLAQVHGRCASTSHERAKSLLVAGEALMRQRHYRKARERYFEPALDYRDIRPEMRAYLWYDMGLCYLTEQAFAAAAEAFRISLSIPVAVRLPTQLPTSPAHLISVQQLQNAAHFYSGIIHLMHHQADQAVRAIKKVQPSPRTGAKLERANTALFLALAHCRLRQPDAAEHALRNLPSAGIYPTSYMDRRHSYALVLPTFVRIRLLSVSKSKKLLAPPCDRRRAGHPPGGRWRTRKWDMPCIAQVFVKLPLPLMKRH